MDDYSIASLNESKNEWCIRLVNILTYHIIDGFKSIFSEAWKICKEQNRWDLISINPSFVVGPALNPLADFQSKKVMLQFGNGDLKHGAPD